MTEILELFGASTSTTADWQALLDQQQCPFLQRKCIKVRKSEPKLSIGTCSVSHGRSRQPMMICPYRLLERKQVFVDCLHLLSHTPGNELHVVPEVSVPGGSVDYFLTAVDGSKVVDFLGIELQTMDTTGSVWPARQRFLDTVRQPDSVAEEREPYGSRFGMNWKMTAKTTLVQLHHKIQTFEALGKRLVLVTQTELFDYLRRNFEFNHVAQARSSHSMQFHTYALEPRDAMHSIKLASRYSTDAAGVGRCLGLKAEPKMELERIVAQLEGKLSQETLLTIG